MTYARNYLFNIPEVSYLNKDDIAKDLADKVEHDLRLIRSISRLPTHAALATRCLSISE